MILDGSTHLLEVNWTFGYSSKVRAYRWTFKKPTVSVKNLRKQMDDILSVIAILFLLHILSFVFFIRYRVYKIVEYCKRFRKTGLLTEKEFSLLEERYNSFLGYMDNFPDPETYAMIYSDTYFVKFRKYSKLIVKYLVLSIMLFTCTLLVFVATGQI